MAQEGGGGIRPAALAAAAGSGAVPCLHQVEATKGANASQDMRSPATLIPARVHAVCQFSRTRRG